MQESNSVDTPNNLVNEDEKDQNLLETTNKNDLEENKEISRSPTDFLDRNALYDPTEFAKIKEENDIRNWTKSYEDRGRLHPISKKSSPNLHVNFPEK